MMSTTFGHSDSRGLRMLLVSGTLVLGTVAGACGVPAPGGGAASPTSAPVAASPVAPSVAATSPLAATSPVVASSPVAPQGAAPGVPLSGSTVGKVDANRATRDDVQRVLTANGVPNAARWAREVEEYRPYPTNDVTFAKLRQELAKYNPAPEVVEQIVASLSL